MSRTPDRVRAQHHPHNVTEVFMRHPNVAVLIPSPASSASFPAPEGWACRGAGGGKLKRKHQEQHEKTSSNTARKGSSSRPSSIHQVHEKNSSSPISSVTARKSTVRCAVCMSGFVPASPLGAGAPGDSAIHCPACVLSVLECVYDAITSGNVVGFEALARANPTLVMDARLSDVVLRSIIASRLLESQGGGVGVKCGNSGGTGGGGKGNGGSRYGSSATWYASSKEVEDEADCWYRDDNRGTVAIEWSGILELNLYSNVLHVAAFVAASTEACKGLSENMNTALFSIIEILWDLDIAETLLGGSSSSSSSSSGCGLDTVSAAKFYGKTKRVLPPPHLDARHKAPVTLARDLGASEKIISLLVVDIE